jgi:hypothetical protein
VAWKIQQILGIALPTTLGNADTWGSRLKADHYSYDNTPEVGDIAAWNTGGGGFGHVAYVYAVSNGIASLDEYNVAGTGLFSSNRTTASNSAGAPSEYVHIGTVQQRGFVATSPLTISAPSGFYQFAPIEESFTFTNETGVPGSIKSLIVGVLDPFQHPYPQVCATGLAMQPGQSYTCNVSVPWGSSGTFTTWADWEDYNNNWHQGQLGPNQTFTLAPAPTFVATSPLTTTAPSGFYQFAPIDESFTITNESGVPGSIKSLIVGVLDPFQHAYPQVCATGLAMQPGQSYTCNVSVPWGSSGDFTTWADWEDYNNNWHQGQLGPNQTFTLAPADTITTTKLPGGVVSARYTTTLAALGGASPYTWTITAGSLPKGLTLSRAGIITGVPAAASRSAVTIRVADTSDPALTASRSYKITIVKDGTATTLTLSVRKVAYGHERAEHLTATVIRHNQGTAPTGMVTVKKSTATLCTITLTNDHGACQLSATQLKPGTYHLIATYVGNNNLSSSTAPSKILTVTK